MSTKPGRRTVLEQRIQNSKTPFKRGTADLSCSAMITMVGALSLFLVLRYTPLLEHLGIKLLADNDAVTRSLWASVALPATFFALASWVSWHPSVHRIYGWLNSKPKIRNLVIVVAVAAVAGIFTFAKVSYGPYTDEVRDVRVVEYLQNHGLSAYLHAPGNAAIEALNPDISFTAGIHPPFHYWASALTGPAANHYIPLRLWALLPLGLALGLVIGLAYLIRFDWLSIFGMAVLIINFTFLRNYTLIRYGNELFSFLGFSTFLTGLWCVYQYPSQHVYRVGAAIASIGLAIAIFSKFSSLVATIAVGCAAFTAWIIFRQRAFLRILAITAIAGVSTVFIYIAAFWGTEMLTYQGSNYVAKSLRVFRLPVPEALTSFTVLEGSSSSIPNFFGMIPVWYGSFIGMLALGASISWLLYSRRLRPLETFVVLLIGFNMAGVLLVNPRAQYTAPILLAVAWLLNHWLSTTYSRLTIFRLYLIGLCFLFSEIFIATI